MFAWANQDSWPYEYGWTLTDPDGNTESGGDNGTPSIFATLPAVSGVTYTYAWTPTSGLDDATSTSPVASNSTTETYTVVVTSSVGCTGTADVVATVSNPTAGTLTGTQTVAPGGTTTISSDGTTGGEWTTSDASVATVDASTGVVTGVFAGTADITYTVGGTACPDAATITVTVACASDITVTYDDVEHCVGNSSTLSGSISDGNVSVSTYTLDLTDGYNDGWGGAELTITVGGVATAESPYTVTAVQGAAAGPFTFTGNPGDAIVFTWANPVSYTHLTLPTSFEV